MEHREVQTDGESRTDTALSFSLIFGGASTLFLVAGVPRSPRRVIRYRTNLHSDYREIDTEKNEKYLIPRGRGSLERRIQELLKVATSPRATQEIRTPEPEGRRGIKTAEPLAWHLGRSGRDREQSGTFNLLSGFVGVTQDDNAAVQAEIFWVLVDGADDIVHWKRSD